MGRVVFLTDIDIADLLMKLVANAPDRRIRKEDIMNELAAQYPRDGIVNAIANLLDIYQLKQTIDFEDEFQRRETWFLEMASEEDMVKLRNLRDIEKAFLRILLEQNKEGQLGQIKYDEARALLNRQGFSEKELRFLWIENITDVIWRNEGSDRVQWCYLIPEWKKSDDYKASLEEARMAALEKESKWRLAEYDNESHENP